MEEFNSDDIFKKMLENPPPMRPDMDALEDMNRRLDAERDKRKGVLWWWLVPLLLVPLLVSSIFFYLKYQTAQQTIYDLNLQLADNQTINKQDTLTQRITIYEYDTVVNTIYREIYLERKKEIPATTLAENGGYFTMLAASFSENASKGIAQAFNTFDKSSLQPSQLELLRSGKVISSNFPLTSPYWGNLNSNLVSGSSSSSSEMETKVASGIVKPIERIAFLDNRFSYLYPLPESDYFLNLATKSSRSKINPLWYFVPTGFKGGISWSPLGIANLPGANNTVQNIGLLGEIVFTRKTSLQLGIEYLQAPLKAEEAAEIALFPAALPDMPSDILREVYGDFNYLQIPLTFKYLLHPTKKWSPTFGLGMIARLPLNEQFRYEFFSVQEGEYTRNQPLVDKGAFSIQNVRGTLGFDYNFYKNYTLQVEGFYNYQFGQSTNPYFNLRYGGLNMGLKYKF